MKKTIFLLAILSSVNAYSQVRIGIVSDLLIPANKYDDKYTSPHTAGGAGLEISFAIKNRLRFNTGIQYVSYKFSKDIALTDNFGNKTNRIATFYNTSGYIGIPVAIRYEFSDKKLSPFASLSVKGLIKTSDGAHVDNGEGYTAQKLNATSFILQPGVDLGLRLLIKEHAYFNLAVSYNYQIQSMYTYFGKDLKYNSVGINLSGGFRF